ncbi:NERD domain-containing protein [Candidatus Enterococcus willemsii]|uniref:Helicase n=1 Tax=Candidatus Enterococcus willemsii TaxID=1857215 RepID=A0ABQ6YY16_9ENTE|nr:NERD domain-containing protein [Enterococcus sp. CU12B]KAF1302919.1 helicase [Enterococcus sp. CU12B]
MFFSKKLSEPIFLREFQDHHIRIEEMKKFSSKLSEEGQKQLAHDVRSLEYGIQGEKNIAFELKHATIPMYILHDIYIEHGERSAQIDYLIFTHKICFVVECKNLYGNIEITNRGDFIRKVGKRQPERIYSPLAQNKRHIDVLKHVLKDENEHPLKKILRKMFQEERYQSVVVLANPRTVVQDRFAKKEIKSQVIQADQLITYIEKQVKESKNTAFSDKDLLNWAQKHLALHQSKMVNYLDNYQKYKKKIQLVNRTELINAVKQFRLQKSREKGLIGKAYYIFTDKQMEALIERMPQNKGELTEVPGFGEKRVADFGAELLEVLKIAQYE